MIRESYGTTTIDYLYDNDGRPYQITVDLGGTKYVGYYVLNQQGDVIALVDEDGAVVLKYTYNAWGKIIGYSTGTSGDGSTLYAYNTLTYRGYYYNKDLGMYYLNSRYYDPQIGRFISADTADVLTAAPTAFTDKNLYAYCDNNPVVRVDSTGAVWETVFDVVSLGASIVEVCVNPTDPWAWIGLAGDTIDLIPIVTGVGEVTRAIKTVPKVNDVIDATTDVARITDHSSKAVASARRSAVRKAWKAEQDNVLNGGTGISRSWTDDEIIELVQRVKVKGYQGHHMKSVKGYPDLVGNPANIQFLTRKEHLAAHNGNFRNITHGKFDYSRRR